MSNALLEAMACACPVISTRVGGTEELMDGNGYFVSGKDTGEIASTIEKIFRDKSAYEQMSARSYGISQGFSWENAALSYHQLIMEYTGKVAH
jgi:glycosyltransferase involved in cell wall biosynthesis